MSLLAAMRSLLLIALTLAQPWIPGNRTFCLKGEISIPAMGLLRDAFAEVGSCMTSLTSGYTFIPQLGSLCKEDEPNFIHMGEWFPFGSTTKQIRGHHVVSAQIKLNPNVLKTASLFYSVALHEVGHVIGLEHTDFKYATMGLTLEKGALNPASTIIPYYHLHLSDQLELQEKYLKWYGYNIECPYIPVTPSLPWYTEL